MNDRENWLRAIEFRTPEWIPCSVQLAPNMWKIHRTALVDLVMAHPLVFPGFTPGQIRDFDRMPKGYRAGEMMIDKWGCKRLCEEDGLAGQAVSHPLESWSALASFEPPDPTRGSLDEITQGHWAFLHGRDAPLTWPEAEEDFRARRSRGELVMGDGEKLLDRLYFLRGFENLMIDFATEPPELDVLIDMLKSYEMQLVDKWLSIGVDAISFHTDFATQTGLMISPRSFRRYLVPLFTALFQKCRRAGVHVFLSSDGRTLEVADDMLRAGVTMHDPQLRPNTIEGIARCFRGRMCVLVDLDQQGFPFMSAEEVRDQVREVRDAIALPEGGLMLRAGVSDPSISLSKIEALIEAMEEVCWHH